MIKFLSLWAKGLGVTIVIVSIFEMLLPNNKNKKYIRMVLGVYVMFNIISPFIKNKEILNLKNFDLETYQYVETISVDQTSMDKRIKKLYEEELKKDIIKKIEEKGYKVTKCEVEAQIANKEHETEIKNIKVRIQKGENNKKEEPKERNEDKIVAEIQKIKKVDTTIKNNQKDIKEITNEKNTLDKITVSDIQNIKNFLIDEYGVNEKCLEIN